MKFFRLISPAVVLSIILAAPAYAAELELKFGHVGAPGSLFEVSVKEFAKRANAKLGDKAKVIGLRLEPARQGQGAAAEAQARHGRLRAAVHGHVLRRRRAVRRVRDALPGQGPRAHGAHREGDLLADAGAGRSKKKGYKIIAVWENGFRHITNNKRPINVPADLQDLKLRTPKGRSGG